MLYIYLTYFTYCLLYLDTDENENKNNEYRCRLKGWWGFMKEERFQMNTDSFIPCQGANGYRLSNPPVLLIATVRASLDIFDFAGGMEPLRRKSLLLTGYLEKLISDELKDCVDIFTPTNPEQRGCQLSLAVTSTAMINANLHNSDDMVKELSKNGVICDSRKPNIIRVAPAPLYNSFLDVLKFVRQLKNILKSAS